MTNPRPPWSQHSSELSDGYFIEQATEDRPIVVATHSHLFLDRERPSSDSGVRRADESVVITPAMSQAELADMTFQSLGNSTEDLFFPGNFLVVEGASDQQIAEKILELLQVPIGKVKVLSAQGIDAVGDLALALERTLIPLVAGSPYATKVVALVDGATDPINRPDLRRVLGDRLFLLGSASLEDFLPEDLYARAGESRQEVINEIARASSHTSRSAIKRRISEKLAAALDEADLARLGAMTDAVRLAVALAPP